MEVGQINQRGQKLIRKTTEHSTTHPHARIWVMYCPVCAREYGSNSCDAHIRKCPYHQDGAEGEPVI